MKEDSPAPKGEIEKISYAESVQRRIKSLKKRLLKIEKNEEMKAKGAQLNQDQIHSISQKGEVLFAIHELEELAKTFISIDEEVVNEQKKLQALQEEREKELLRQAKIEETKQRSKDLENYYILLHVMDPNLQEAFLTNQIEEFSLTQEHINILVHMYSQIFPKFEPGSRVDQTISLVFENTLKLFNQSKEELTSGVTYASVYQLLDSIKKCAYFDPDVAHRIANEKAAREAEERRKKYDLEENYEIIDRAQVPAFSVLSHEQINGVRPPVVTFMSNSELGEEVPSPLSSFELQAGQLPTVIVPVPEKLLGREPRLAPWAKFPQQPQQVQPQQPQQQETQKVETSQPQQQQAEQIQQQTQQQPQQQPQQQGENGERRQQHYNNRRPHHNNQQQGDGAPRRSSAYGQQGQQGQGQQGSRPRNTGNYNREPRDGQQGNRQPRPAPAQKS